MATVTSSKRQLTHTSNTYESNGDVTIGGNLNINGTTTTIDTANLLVEDKNIIIGDVSSPSDTTADGGGITLKGASDKTINWVNSTDSWTSNQRFSAPNLTLTGLSNQSSEATALVVNGSNVVGTRELGSNAFNSTSFLTSYTETDTLATVTARGNTTSQAITISNQLSTTNTIFARKDNVSNYTDANIRLDSFGGSSSTVGIGFHISGQIGKYLRMNSSGVLAWEGSTVWHAGNDGSGSGLDADLLDGVHKSSFLRSDAADTATGLLTLNGGVHILSGTGGGKLRIKRNSNSTDGDDIMDIHMDDGGIYFDIDNDNDNDTANVTFRYKTGGSFTNTLVCTTSGILYKGNTIWHAGNDGSGTGLDADLLDGNHASAFATASHSHAASDITSGTLATARIPSLAASKITSGTFADARIASASNWNTAYTDRNKWDGGSTGLNASTGRTSLGLGSAATSNTSAFAAAGDENIIDGATSIWNADGDGDVFTYNDSNPTHNSKGTGAVIYIRGDGTNDHSLVRAGIFTSDHVSTANGYYVGTLLGTGNSTTTQVINGSGEWTGSVIPAAKLSTATTQSSSDNSTKIATTAYVKNQSYLTTSGKAADSQKLDNLDSLRFPYALTGSLGSTNTFVSDGGIGADNITRSMFYRDNGNQFGTIGFNAQHATSTAYAWQMASTSYSNASAIQARVKNNGTWSSPVTIWNSGNDGSGSGLDADTLDGLQLNSDDRNDSANVVCRTQANGYAYFGWLNTTSGNNGTTAISRIYASHDGFVRYYTPANFGAQIGSHISYNDLTNKPTIPSLSGYATEAHVSSEISNLIGGAPAALDTLNELAAAIGDDASYASSITTALAAKAPLASPALTGAVSVTGSGSSGNAFAVMRGSDGAQVLRIQNTGEVVVQNNYLYAAASGNSLYVQNGAIFRGSIINDTSGQPVTIGDDLYVSSDLTIGSGTSQSNLHIKKADNDVSDHIVFYNGTTRVGEIGVEDTTWLRINQETAKNIYTPRYIRADGGFFVDGASKGIDGSGNFIGGTITGASDANVSNWNTAYGWGNHASAGYLTSSSTQSKYLRSDAADTASGVISFTGGHGAINITNSSILSSATSNWTGDPGGAGKIQYHANRWYIVSDSSSNRIVQFRRNSSDVSYIDNSGNFVGNVTGNASTATSTTKLAGFSNQTEHDLIRAGNLNGLYMKARWDSSTSNRFWDMGYVDGNGTFYSGLKVINNGDITYKGNEMWHAGNDGSGSGLDADLLDGLDLHTGRNNEANKVVRTDGNGYIQAGWINTTSGANTTQAINRVYASTDSYIRYYSAADFGAGIGQHISYNDLTNKPTIPSAYSLPLSSSSTRGGVKIGFSESGKNYPVELDSSEKMFVNVPWTDTNTNTTYSAGTGISLSGTTFSLTDTASKLSLSGGTMTGTLNSRDIKFANGYHLTRSNHSSGHLEGSYNNVGANGDKSNPIYTIGSSYNPTDAALSNMYGIGYCNASASFISLTGASSWGQYVAADGDARIWLGGTNGVISSTGEHYVGSNRVHHNGYHPNADTLTTARTIALGGDVTGSASFNGGSNITISASLSSGSVGASEIAANAVGASEIAASAVGASELNVSGNGSTSQFLRSDGDGTFTWATPTDTNTTYSAGRGLDESSGEFQLETDLRDSISYIGYDSNDYIQWSNNSYCRTVVSGSERFRVNTSGIDVNGTATASGFQTDTSSSNYNLISRNGTSFTLYVQAAQSNSTQPIASFRYGSATANGGTETFRIRKDNVNVFGANFTVGGSITGNSKNFSIPHPTKEGKRLVHSCLEGPEIGVYFRGRSTSATIEMPDYWAGLVHLDSMTVELTAIGPNQDLYVDNIADDGDVTVASNTEESLNYFYVIYGERKDLERLEVEIDDTVEVEESSDNSEEP